jgi:hypothetical protein
VGSPSGRAAPRPARWPPAVSRLCRPASAPAQRSDIIVDLEVYNGAGQRVAQNAIGGQSFSAGQARDYSWPLVIPTSFAAGTYTFGVGIFSSGWSTLFLWVNNAATFQVGGGSPPPPPSCTGGFSVGPSSATPSPVARGATETLQTRVCSGTAQSNIIVDLEIYNAAGQKVAQNVIGGQAFTAGQARDYSWPFPVATAFPAGTYTFKVGIFSSDWSTLFLWVNNAATFVVQ